MSRAETCAGCIHARPRLKWSKPRNWCAKFGRLHEVGCIDYKKKKSVAAALKFYKSLSIK